MATIGFVHPEFLIDTESLERRLGDPDLRMFDCTTNLIPDPKTTYQAVPARADFEKGHIPGAQFIDLQADLSDQGQRLRFMQPSAEAFAAAMRRFGVGDGNAGRALQHRQPVVGDAGVVAVAGVRLRRRGGARRRLAEMEPRRPPGRNRRRPGDTRKAISRSASRAR